MIKKQTPTTFASINLKALEHNLSITKQAAPSKKVMAVIKADAYGHGLIPCVNALHHADGFAVARFAEAQQLVTFAQHQVADKPILIMSDLLTTEEYNFCCEHHIIPTLFELEQIKQLCQIQLKKPLSIWLKIDTGMHRLGLLPEEINEALALLNSHPNIKINGVMSHFACADETQNPTPKKQLEQFSQATTHLNINRSIANSAGILLGYTEHCQWVRPGIMLYGADPLDSPTTLSQNLQPVMTLQSTITAIRVLNPGESVGYGHTWQAQRTSHIASIAIGYGDGYPRHVPSGSPVLVQDKGLAPLVGRVSMDTITVDVTDLPKVNVGDKVTLWGEGLPVELIAQQAQTISYQLLTCVMPRVPRVYL